MYGRWEKRGREAGFSRWRVAGEIGKNYATLRNVLQLRKSKEAGDSKKRVGTETEGYGRREV